MNSKWISKSLSGLVIGLVLISLLSDPALAAAVNSNRVESYPAGTFTDCAAQTQIPAAECNALLALYNTTHGASWTHHTGWLQTDTPCTWHGVTCNMGHVTGLNQYYNNLSGSIPSQLSSLTHLESLWLIGNHLAGTIPVELANLTNLTDLDLSMNELSGGIPSQLGSLTNLTRLQLGANQLTGSIPTPIGSLINLHGLWLYSNQLTGSIPVELGGLTKLTVLNLAYNELTGSIPSQLGNLTDLTELWLAGNHLTGSIPVELANLTKLTHLDLGCDNRLTGSIPPQLGNLTNLRYLYLEHNRLTGNVPAELGNLTQLEILLLHNNNLGGEIPASITNLSSLTRLDLSCGLFSTNPSVVAFVDGLVPGWRNNICPVVSSILRSAPNPTSSNTVSFTVTFSKSVTGVSLLAPFNDFALAPTGITGASITSISGSEDTYTVTAATGSGPGTLRLDVLDDNTIVDAVSHTLGGIEAGDGNFTDGEPYTIWGFKGASRWTTAFDLSHGWTVSQYARTTGDVNGDNKADVVGFGLDGVYVSLSNGSAFGQARRWTNGFDLSHGWTVQDYVRTVGDVNGDGKDDLVGFGLDGVYVALSNGSAFGTISKWTNAFDLSHGWTVSQYVRTVGDVNGDGRADLVGFGLDGVYVALSTGSSFGPITKRASAFDRAHGWTVQDYVRTLGDVNGDGKDDLVGFGFDGVYIALSTGSGFGAVGKWTSAFDLSHGWTVSQYVRTVGDINGDGKADLTGFGSNGVYIALSTGSGFAPVGRWTNAFDLSHGWTVSQYVRTAGDVNGDGKAELVGFGLDGVYIAASR